MPSVVLHQFPPAGAMPSLSPYCWKVQMALALKGVAYEINNTLFPKKHNRNGKLPYLVWDGIGIEDSTAIVRAIDARAGEGPRLVPEDPAHAGEAHLLEDWADESLYWHAVYAKFEDDDGWSHISAALGVRFPAAARAAALMIARRDARKKLRAQGLSKRSNALVLEEFDRHLDALDRRLASARYLVGGAPTIADLAVGAMLGQLTVGMTPGYGERIAKRERLSEYLKRVLEKTAR